MKVHSRLLIAGMLIAAAAWCHREEPVADTPAPVEHMATGTLNSIDLEAGTVNISHGPVPSAGWPQMTMDFKLSDKSAAEKLEPGERVDVHFTIEGGMNATVTEITPIE